LRPAFAGPVAHRQSAEL